MNCYLVLGVYTALKHSASYDMNAINVHINVSTIKHYYNIVRYPYLYLQLKEKKLSLVCCLPGDFINFLTS